METNTNDPQEETPQDQIADYHADIKQIEMEGYELGIKKARNALFWAAGLLLLGQLVATARDEGEVDMYSYLFLAPFLVGFVVLGILTKQKPYTSIIIGICLFIGHWLWVIVTNIMYGDDMGIFKAFLGGILVRIIILVLLIRPLKDAKEVQKAKDEKVV